jgi:hypothetical protein
MNCKSKKIKNPALAFSAANNPSTRFSEEDQYQLSKGFSSKKEKRKDQYQCNNSSNNISSPLSAFSICSFALHTFLIRQFNSYHNQFIIHITLVSSSFLYGYRNKICRFSVLLLLLLLLLLFY